MAPGISPAKPHNSELPVAKNTIANPSMAPPMPNTHLAATLLLDETDEISLLCLN